MKGIGGNVRRLARGLIILSFGALSFSATPTLAVVPERTSPGNPSELWEGANVGMTASDIQNLFPGTHARAHPEANPNGSQQLLEGADLLIGGRRQHVSFTFDQGRRLIEVDVVLGGAQHLGEIAGPDVHIIFNEHKARYGQPVRCGNAENQLYACYWIVNGKFVGYMGRDHSGPVVMLFFRQARADDWHIPIGDGA